jgi:dienelactone hydrolase
MKVVSAALFVCLVNGVVVARAQTITVTPERVLVDETAAIRATGLKAGEHVAIHGELVDGDGKTWRSEAEFVADAEGIVDATKQAPVKGTYRNSSAMGLIWSMKPVSKDTHIYRPPHAFGQQTVRFELVSDGKEVSSAELQQMAITDQVRQIKVEGKLHGVLFLPNKVGKSPGVLVLGGSEGGTPARRAAWLASHGYAALALAYFHAEGVPDMLHNIPLEYFGQALGWMEQRPEIDRDHIAVMGVSRGGELALQIGSLYRVQAVVAYVPANVRYPACCGGVAGAAWTWKGMPLEYAQPGRDRTIPVSTPGAVIHVETTPGPILVISGQDDGIWPSSLMTNAVVGRLRLTHFAYPFERLDYPHAGHRAGLPDIIPAWTSPVPHPVSGTMENFGGSPEGNAASSLDAAPKVLEFLQRSLGSESLKDSKPTGPGSQSPAP